MAEAERSTSRMCRGSERSINAATLGMVKLEDGVTVWFRDWSVNRNSV